MVQRGITRTVLLVGSWAIKVPSFRGGSVGGARGRLQGFAQGYLSNLSERTWCSYEPWEGRVAPVLRSWLFGLVQVYPRCRPMDLDDWSWDAGWTYHGKLMLPLLDPSPGDFKPDNFGWLAGRLVRLDYDMACSCRSGPMTRTYPSARLPVSDQGNRRALHDR